MNKSIEQKIADLISKQKYWNEKSTDPFTHKVYCRDDVRELLFEIGYEQLYHTHISKRFIASKCDLSSVPPDPVDSECHEYLQFNNRILVFLKDYFCPYDKENGFIHMYISTKANLINKIKALKYTIIPGNYLKRKIADVVMRTAIDPLKELKPHLLEPHQLIEVAIRYASLGKELSLVDPSIEDQGTLSETDYSGRISID